MSRRKPRTYHKPATKVVYTAIMGGYDRLKEPQPRFRTPGYDYICFTNSKALKSRFWRIVYIDDDEGLDPCRLARKIKILGHPALDNYDLSVWVDGSIEIRTNIDTFLKSSWRDEDILIMRHPDRDCVYEEAEACIWLKKDNEELIALQMEGYQQEGYPKHNGMVATGLMIRNCKSERLKEMMERWWMEVCFKSMRDQLSFNYVLSKSQDNIKIGYLDYNVVFRRGFRLLKHNKRVQRL